MPTHQSQAAPRDGDAEAAKKSGSVVVPWATDRKEQRANGAEDPQLAFKLGSFYFLCACTAPKVEPDAEVVVTSTDRVSAIRDGEPRIDCGSGGGTRHTMADTEERAAGVAARTAGSGPAALPQAQAPCSVGGGGPSFTPATRVARAASATNASEATADSFKRGAKLAHRENTVAGKVSMRSAERPKRRWAEVLPCLSCVCGVATGAPRSHRDSRPLARRPA